MRRSPRRPNLAHAAAVALLVTSVVACSSETGGQPDDASAGSSTGSTPSGTPSDAPSNASSGDFPVEVSGDLGSEPEVTFDSPLDLDETVSEVVVEGEGEPVEDGTPVLLDLYLANGATGERIASSYEEQPVATQLSAESIFPAAYDALSGQPLGTRAAAVVQPADGYGDEGMPQLQLEPGQDLVVVFDLVSAAPTDYPRRPEGQRQDKPGFLPDVETDNGAVTGLDFSGAREEPPSGLELYTLIEGEGEPITAPSFAAFNYFGQVWGADAPFDQSFDSEPLVQPVGLGQFIEGWDEALVGVTGGSRVMLVVPPEKGYGEAGQPSAGIEGDDTMVFVIDILAVG